jgi:hypothetical protein
VLIVKLPDAEKVTRIAVRLSGCMTVVQVRRDKVFAEAAIVCRQVVVVAHQDRLAVTLDIKWTGNQTVKAPEWLDRQCGVSDDVRQPLFYFVKLHWRKLTKRLMRDDASFAGRGVWYDCRRGIQHRGRLFHG